MQPFQPEVVEELRLQGVGREPHGSTDTAPASGCGFSQDRAATDIHRTSIAQGSWPLSWPLLASEESRSQLAALDCSGQPLPSEIHKPGHLESQGKYRTRWQPDHLTPPPPPRGGGGLTTPSPDLRSPPSPAVWFSLWKSRLLCNII